MLAYGDMVRFRTNGRAWIGDIGGSRKRLDLMAGDWVLIADREEDGKLSSVMLYESGMLEHVMDEANVKRELSLYKKLIPVEQEIARRLNSLILASEWYERWGNDRIDGDSMTLGLMSGIVCVSGESDDSDDVIEEAMRSALKDGKPSYGVVGDVVVAGLFSHKADVTVIRDKLFDEVRAIKVERA